MIYRKLVSWFTTYKLQLRQNKSKRKRFLVIVVLSLMGILIFGSIYLSQPVRRQFSAHLLMNNISFTLAGETSNYRLISGVTGSERLRLAGLSQFVVENVTTSSLLKLKGRSRVTLQMEDGGVVYLSSLPTTCNMEQVSQNSISPIGITEMRVPVNTEVENIRYDLNPSSVTFELRPPTNESILLKFNQARKYYFKLQNVLLNGEFLDCVDLSGNLSPEISLNDPFSELISLKINLAEFNSDLGFPTSLKVKNFSFNSSNKIGGPEVQDRPKTFSAVKHIKNIQIDNHIPISLSTEVARDPDIQINGGSVDEVELGKLQVLREQDRDQAQGIELQLKGRATSVEVDSQIYSVSGFDLIPDDLLDILKTTIVAVIVSITCSVLTTLSLKWIE